MGPAGSRYYGNLFECVFEPGKQSVHGLAAIGIEEIDFENLVRARFQR
jgi:hypothetical protein